MSPIYNELRDALLPRYDAREARAVALLVLEDAFGVPRMDVYADKVRHFSEEERRRLQNILQRLAAGEPVQYVLGRAAFCGMNLRVTPATLIPRPETAELVDAAETLCEKILETLPADQKPLQILDAGTGSGCIALALAQRLPSAKVEAWDISSEALDVAQQNAAEQNLHIDFQQRDILAEAANCSSEPVNPSTSISDAEIKSVSEKSSISEAKIKSISEKSSPRYHLIVSNPPYIAERERPDMAAHVLDYEPHTALFVPDDDPLRFYRALAHIARRTLHPGGALAVEINQAYGTETLQLFAAVGFTSLTLLKDAFGRDRIVTARQPSPSA